MRGRREPSWAWTVISTPRNCTRPRNRVSVSPDLIRRLGGALGYDAIEAFGPEAQTELSKVFDLGDIIDLILLSQLPDLEVAPGVEQQIEGDVAKQLLRHISAGDYLTRQQVHDRLPRATVMLYRMGHPRLWAFAARQRLPQDAERAVPDSFHRDITGPYTTPEEAWLGMYVADATRLGELNTQVEDAGLEEDRQQRLRLGMSLADTYPPGVEFRARPLACQPPDALHRAFAFWLLPLCLPRGRGWVAPRFLRGESRSLYGHGGLLDRRRARTAHSPRRPRPARCMAAYGAGRGRSTDGGRPGRSSGAQWENHCPRRRTEKHYDSPAPEEPHIEL